jgi:hypothetical protein
MSKGEKAGTLLGSLVVVFTIACGLLSDLGWSGTSWACGILATASFLIIAPTMEVFDAE